MQPHQLSNQQQNNSIEISIVKLLNLKPMPDRGDATWQGGLSFQLFGTLDIFIDKLKR